MRLDLHAMQLQPGRDQRIEQQPAREARNLFFAQRRRRIGEHCHPVPAADFHLAELRVRERLPRHVTFAGCNSLRPLEHLEVVFDRVIAEPVDPLVIVDTGFLLRIPDLDGPRVHAEVLVDPVEGARDVLLRVVLELVPDADRRIAGQFLALAAHGLVGPQVFGGQRVVGRMAERPQQHATERVQAGATAQVRMRGEELHHRAHLGLAGGEGAGAELLELLPPARRKVAVQIEALGVAIDAGHRDRLAVVVGDAALGHHAVVVAAGRIERVASHHELRLRRMLLPRAVGVSHAHLQQAAVAVDILGQQALGRLLVVRIAACRRAHVARPVGHRPFGAVGVDARRHVQRAGVELARDLLVVAVVLQQPVDEVQAGARCRQFDRVDVAVDPVGGLVLRRASGEAGQRQQRDRPAFVAVSDLAVGGNVGSLGSEGLEQADQVVVAVEAGEVDGGHVAAAGRWMESVGGS